MPHRQNTVHISWTILAGGRGGRLHLTPEIHFRNYEESVDAALHDRYALTIEEDHYAVTSDDPRMLPPLRMRVVGAESSFAISRGRRGDLHYRLEQDRGYQYEGELWTPGVFTLQLEPGRTATFVATTEPRDVMLALEPGMARAAERERRRRLFVRAPESARDGVGPELLFAADQFLITPAGRVADRTRAMAAGDEVRTVIAGYHWFTDWGRDTMISLEGLTISTGRNREAAFILRTFAQYVKDGLLPNLFPDGSNSGLYHTADATLWFFHAVERFLRATNDRNTLAMILPVLVDIAEHHLRGTHFGIAVDSADGLLRQGAEGYQLTWMDAKVDDWVVTPRRGKAVELNALWYNALRLLARWTREAGRTQDAARYDAAADRVREAFNRRFWYADGGYLHDVVDGPDGDSTECRPNQIFAISLDHPVLDEARWRDVLRVVQERLLTPVGLRSLAPGSRDYKSKYWGDLRARDAAYHQGTVWGWLIGPWVDAWLRVHPEDVAGARRFLDGLVAHLDDFGVGSVAEIFDAEEPYTPRGCIAQAWSVAELLRCWVRTEPRGAV
jgi:predicted glycogen debranching enzyme